MGVPRYPSSAWQNCRSGWVIFKFTVLNGCVHEPSVLASLGGPIFEAEGRVALLGFRFPQSEDSRGACVALAFQHPGDPLSPFEASVIHSLDCPKEPSQGMPAPDELERLFKAFEHPRFQPV